MKTTQQISMAKAIYIFLAAVGSLSTLSYATTPGNVEAINSASDALRNIIGIEISTATDPKDPKWAPIVAACRKEGVLVSAVIPGHPAATAGLKVGDIITNINNTRVETTSEALEIMDGLEAGRHYPFEVCRLENNKVEKVTVNILVEKVQEKALGKIS